MSDAEENSNDGWFSRVLHTLKKHKVLSILLILITGAGLYVGGGFLRVVFVENLSVSYTESGNEKTEGKKIDASEQETSNSSDTLADGAQRVEVDEPPRIKIINEYLAPVDTQMPTPFFAEIKYMMPLLPTKPLPKISTLDSTLLQVDQNHRFSARLPLRSIWRKRAEAVLCQSNGY